MRQIGSSVAVLEKIVPSIQLRNSICPSYLATIAVFSFCVSMVCSNICLGICLDLAFHFGFLD